MRRIMRCEWRGSGPEEGKGVVWGVRCCVRASFGTENEIPRAWHDIYTARYCTKLPHLVDV